MFSRSIRDRIRAIHSRACSRRVRRTGRTRWVSIL
jgi:hypothetical protein